MGVFYPYNRGALFTALVVIYALTSGIAGYTATSFYCQLEGTNWVREFLFSILFLKRTPENKKGEKILNDFKRHIQRKLMANHVFAHLLMFLSRR